ncbi:MAG: asparaginase [Granulosicoccaceae bacterium]
MSADSPNPVLAELTRGPLVESRHRGAVAVATADGRLRYACGDVDSPVFARSALKPLQAIPLLETGAADACGASDEQIALACASHNGEDCHHDLAAQWLSDLGLDESHLACGEDAPLGEAARERFFRADRRRGRLFHNCSGKHAGMLAVCCHCGDGVTDYQAHHHPSQQRWLRVLGEMCDLDGTSLPWDYDGCGLSAPATPLRSLATGMARMADPSGLASARQQACERVHQSVTAHPYLVAGEQRACTQVMQVLGERLTVKVGAEGVYAGFIPSLGLGFALKVDDGARRGAEIALGGLLGQLGLLDDDSAVQLSDIIQPQLRNSRGDVVGLGRAARSYLESWA